MTLIGLTAESSSCLHFTTPSGWRAKLEWDRKDCANRIFKFICFYLSLSPNPSIPHSDGMENDISSTAHEPVFIFQIMHFATDLLQSEKTFTALTLGEQTSNTVSYLLVLKSASKIPIHTCHSNNHWIFCWRIKKSLISWQHTGFLCIPSSDHTAWGTCAQVLV